MLQPSANRGWSSALGPLPHWGPERPAGGKATPKILVKVPLASTYTWVFVYPLSLGILYFFSFQLLPGQDANKHGRVGLPGESDECRHAFANSFCLFCLFFSFPFSCFYFPGTEGRNSIFTLTSGHHKAPVMKRGNFYNMYVVKMRLVNSFQVAASTAGALLASGDMCGLRPCFLTKTVISGVDGFPHRPSPTKSRHLLVPQAPKLRVSDTNSPSLEETGEHQIINANARMCGADYRILRG